MDKPLSSSRIIRTVWVQALPVMLGYLPIGFAFGILAQKSGISAANTLFLSLLVYAGSSQLIAASLIAASAGPWSIILTTFVVNLRHLLMSAALAPYLRGWKKPQIAWFAFELTDETFGLHSVRFPQAGAQPGEALLVNGLSQLAWVLGTGLGIAAGGLIADVTPWGLDYALVAMFAALLVFQIKDRRFLLVALLGGGLSAGLLLAGAGQWSVILAAVFAATVGVWIDSWIKKPSS